MDELTKQIYADNRRKTYDELDELFSANYRALLLLIPVLSEIKKDVAAHQTQPLPLYLIVEERTPYTGTYKLTHIINGIKRPDIRFKVYFDMQLVEVLSVCDKESINDMHSYLDDCSDITLRWEINYFLARWLEYCLKEHYLFLL